MTTQTSASPRPATPRQLEVLEVIRRAIAEQGMPPTVRELAAALGVRSTNAVIDHLHALERKGLLRHSPGTARAWRPVASEGAIDGPARWLDDALMACSARRLDDTAERRAVVEAVLRALPADVIAAAITQASAAVLRSQHELPRIAEVSEEIGRAAAASVLLMLEVEA